VDSVQRRWLFTNAIAVTAAVNVVLNALPAWGAVQGGGDRVPLWSVPVTSGTGLYTDTLGTLLILPFVTTLLVTTATWRARRRGVLPPLQRLPYRLRALALLPRARLARAAVLSAATLGSLAGPAAVALGVLVPDGLADVAFVVYKTVLGVVLGLIVTPLVALRAMADPLD
jgi:hypothetical protein